MRSTLRTLIATGAALVASGGVTSAAGAASLVVSSSSCAPQTFSQPFMPWGDPAQYFLSPGGSFENGAPGWSLSGGAAVSSGNEPFHVGSPADSASLTLPAGSQAVSAPVCLSATRPTIRFFAKGGAIGSALSVDAVIPTGSGAPSTLPLGSILATGAWSPTAPVLLALSDTYSVIQGSVQVSFRFTPQAGSWRIDDVYVDPWNRG